MHASQDINQRHSHHTCCGQSITPIWPCTAPQLPDLPNPAMQEGGMARRKRKGRPRGDPARLPEPRQSERSFQPQEGNKEKSMEYVTMGVDCQRRGKHDQAMTLYDKAIKVDPTCINAYSNKGAALVMLEKPTEALAYLERAVKLMAYMGVEKDHIMVYTNLATVLDMLGRHDEAVTCLDMAFNCMDKNNPDRGEQEMVAYLFEALGEKGKAAACRRSSGSQAWKYQEEGLQLAKQGRDAEAAACFDRAIRENPSFVEAHYSKGTMMRNLGKSGDALACFRQAVKINPDFVLAYSDIAIELNHMGRDDEALEYVETAIRKDPNLGVALFCKGAILASTKRYREAITWFDRAAKKEPDRAVIYLKKGMSHRALGENREALRCFNRALKLDPRYAEAMRAKSETEAALGISTSRSWWDKMHDRR